MSTSFSSRIDKLNDPTRSEQIVVSCSDRVGLFFAYSPYISRTTDFFALDALCHWLEANNSESKCKTCKWRDSNPYWHCLYFYCIVFPSSWHNIGVSQYILNHWLSSAQVLELIQYHYIIFGKRNRFSVTKKQTINQSAWLYIICIQKTSEAGALFELFYRKAPPLHAISIEMTGFFKALVKTILWKTWNVITKNLLLMQFNFSFIDDAF